MLFYREAFLVSICLSFRGCLYLCWIHSPRLKRLVAGLFLAGKETSKVKDSRKTRSNWKRQRQQENKTAASTVQHFDLVYHTILSSTRRQTL